jgi:hypothetical protein
MLSDALAYTAWSQQKVTEFLLQISCNYFSLGKHNSVSTSHANAMKIIQSKIVEGFINNTILDFLLEPNFPALCFRSRPFLPQDLFQ